MAYPQLPAGTNRSTGSLCWGRASPGMALCLSSSCMSNTWPAFPPVAARTTSQTSEALLGTSRDLPPAPGMTSLPQRLDPNTLNMELTVRGWCFTRINRPLSYTYSNLALYKAGDVFTGVKNRERPHDVLLQPIPVLTNLLFGDTCKSGKENSTVKYHVWEFSLSLKTKSFMDKRVLKA